MFNKNSTPFKLKGSPFKKDPTVKNKLIGGAAGRNTDFTTQADGSTPTEYTNTRRNVYDGDNLVQSNGGGNDVINLTQEAVSGPPAPVEKNINGSVSNADGSINHAQVRTTTGGSTQAGAGNILTGNLPSYKQAWEKDIDSIRTGKGYGGNYENYLADMNKIVKGDARDVEREAARAKVQSVQVDSSNQNSGDTEEQIKANKLQRKEYGTKQSSYESRKNVRTTKSNANTIKNNTIGKGRQTWKGMSENQKLLATGGTKEMKEVDGKQVATGNIIGGSGKRGEYMKSIKSKAKVEKKDAIIAKAKSELLNSQRASDQNIGLGGKVEGRTVDVTTADTQAVIEAAQNASNQSNNLIKKGVKAGTIDKLTDSKLKFKGGAKYGKRSTPFKQQGYTFGASKK
tara:strand:+ start:1125 stop:2321 length:1197 start_codon:yes stop_codon:yes gene_type:complete